MSSEQERARSVHHAVSSSPAGDPEALERRVRDEFARARRYSLSFSLVLLDVDDLHALDGIGALLRRELREPDFVARYGSAEFALVLPETDSDGARHSVARVRHRIAEQPIEGMSPAGRPQVSAGIVTYPHPAVARADDLFGLLEAALRRGKAQSGERIAVAP